MLFIDAFIQNNRLDHITQMMGYHPDYLDCFLRTQQYLLRGDGPLPYHYRHYIAIMVNIVTFNLLNIYLSLGGCLFSQKLCIVEYIVYFSLIVLFFLTRNALKLSVSFCCHECQYVL